MTDIDILLGASLKRLAPSGDAAGVADAIRSRVDAGDTGAPASASGFGSGGGGVAGWLPWVGIVVVAGIVGGAAGATGLAGRDSENVSVNVISSQLVESAPALSCPGGPVVTTLAAGTRVLAVERAEGYLGVRDPGDFARVLWLAGQDVTVDSEQPDAAALPEGSPCPVAILAAPVVAPPVVVPPAGGGTPSAPDTTAPTIGKPTADTDPVCSAAGSGGDHTSTISVTASDNVGVTAVSISWSGAASGSASMSGGGTWTYTYTSANSSSGSLTFTVQASDAAGNMSQQGSVTIQQLGCVG